MTDSVAPEYARFIADERRAKRLEAVARPMPEGEVLKPVSLKSEQASQFLRVAAQRASGLFRPSRHTEVVWVQGDSELAVSLVGLQVQLTEGLIRVTMPVRCDQTGSVNIEVVFAVGSAKNPSGLYAATFRRPIGPAVIVDTWGEALVAFAWQGVLGMVSGIAGAVGKDARGNVMVPAELNADKGVLQIVPMARHRFAGSSGLKVSP
jgi:hypothetical protein